MTATIDSDTSFVQLPSIHGVKHSGSLELGLHSTTIVNLHLMFGPSFFLKVIIQTSKIGRCGSNAPPPHFLRFGNF
jgi:hypothetical protein